MCTSTVNQIKVLQLTNRICIVRWLEMNVISSSKVPEIKSREITQTGCGTVLLVDPPNSLVGLAEKEGTS